MQDNTRRFDGKASLYGQYRPSYPAEYFDYLFQKARLKPEDAIADIGAGTGIFTRQLLERRGDWHLSPPALGPRVFGFCR